MLLCRPSPPLGCCMGNESWLIARDAQSQHYGRTSGRRAASTRRLPFPITLVEPAVFVADIMLIVSASVLGGIVYSWIFLGNPGEIPLFLGLGVLTAAYCSS